jgi:predicted TPR repeat methyltransferase/Tfp pilus assembly protein PilF
MTTPAQPAEQTFFERLEQAVDFVRTEQMPEAEAALAALLEERPDQPDALHFLGILRHVQGRSDEGIALIRRAVALRPGQAGMLNNLGNLLFETQQLDAAVEVYEQALAAAGPGQADSADPLHNLGVIHRRNDRLDRAEQCMREAIALRPNSGASWYGLSEVLIAQGRVSEGLLANSQAIVLLPRESIAREQVIKALVLLGQREQAAELYREWLAEEPDNPIVQHQLAACLGQEAPDRASDAYVATVFDHFAPSFDAKLEKLGYRAPQHVAAACAAVLGAPAGRLQVADVGCGTGLCGPLLRPWAGQLLGCDLSVGMLRQARQRQVYDKLHKAELVYYLDTQPGEFDLVVSADTLCYFGALEAAFAASHRSLRPGGWLVFTVEALAADAGRDHHILPQGRYAHAEGYLRRGLAEAGLDAVSVGAVTLRMEAGQPVAGWVVTAQRPA